MSSEAQLQREVEAARKTGSADSARLWTALQKLAEWYHALRQPADAIPHWTEICNAVDASTAPAADRGAAHARLAFAFQECGDWLPAEREYRRALELFQQESQLPVLDYSITLTRLAEIEYQQNRFAAALESCTTAHQWLLKVTGPAHPEMLRVRNNLAAVHLALEHVLEAEELYRANLQAVAWLESPNSPRLIPYLNNLAEVMRLRRRPDLAERCLERSRELGESGRGVDPALKAHTLSQLAELRRQQGRFSVAEQMFREALENRRQAYPADHPLIARSLRSLGETLLRRGKPRDAEPLLDEALRITERTFGTEHPHVAGVLVALSRVCLAQGRQANAERLAQRALKIQKAALPAGDLSVSDTLTALADVALARKQWPLAQQRNQDALTRQLSVAGDPPPSLPMTFRQQAQIELARNQPDDARQALQQAKLLLLDAAGPDHPELGLVDLQRAHVALALHDLSEARRLSERARQLFDRLPERALPDIVELAATLAEVALQRGLYDIALNYAQQELELRERWVGTDHPTSLPTLLRMGDACRGLLDDHAAQEMYLTALQRAERLYGAAHPQVATYVERLARLALLARRMDDFRAWMQRAVQLMNADAGPETAAVAGYLDDYVTLLTRAGESAEAARVAEQAEQLRNRSSHVLSDLM